MIYEIRLSRRSLRAALLKEQHCIQLTQFAGVCAIDGGHFQRITDFMKRLIESASTIKIIQPSRSGYKCNGRRICCPNNITVDQSR